MPIATMTSKGQITLPKEMRDDLKLAAGSKVMFVRLPNGQYAITPRTGTVEDFLGMFYDPERPALTLDEMDEAIAQAVIEDDLRTRSA